MSSSEFFVRVGIIFGVYFLGLILYGATNWYLHMYLYASGYRSSLTVDGDLCCSHCKGKILTSVKIERTRDFISVDTLIEVRCSKPICFIRGSSLVSIDLMRVKDDPKQDPADWWKRNDGS